MAPQSNKYVGESVEKKRMANQFTIGHSLFVDALSHILVPLGRHPNSLTDSVTPFNLKERKYHLTQDGTRPQSLVRVLS